MAKYKKELGRPPKYHDPVQFERRCDEYFESIMNEDGTWRRPPTMSGLALFLGFMDRRSMYYYRDKDSFYEPVKRAMAMIEMYHEERLASGDRCVGNIFALKNMGWSDKTEHTSKQETTITWNETRSYEKGKGQLKNLKKTGTDE